MRAAAGLTRRGFSLIELVVVMVIMGIVAGLALPKLNLAGYRVDAAAQQVRSTLQTAQRMALTTQHDVLVSFDTVNQRIRIAPDGDNNGTIDATESRLGRWRATGSNDGNTFATPPRGLSVPVVNTPVLGSTLRRVNGMATLTFHRDGSASSEVEVYLANRSRGAAQWRMVSIVRSTGRTAMYRLTGTGTTQAWTVAR